MVGMINFLLLLGIALPSVQSIPAKREPKELIVFASGNLKDQLVSISQYFERSNPEWKVKYKFGPSYELTQLADGRLPVDVLVISDQENIETLQQQDRISKKDVVPIVSNRVVIVGDVNIDFGVKEAKDLVTGEDIKKLALSGEKTPLGNSAREYLKKLGLSTIPSDKLVSTKNPRAAVVAVKTEEAKWTFCYGTDTAGAKRLKVLFWVPPTEIPSIDYFTVVPKTAKNKDAANHFVEVLQSTISRMLFQNAGYTLTMPQPSSTQTAPKEKTKQND
jgi:molybdenum ABC transporter molybdate-binding protein